MQYPYYTHTHLKILSFYDRKNSKIRELAECKCGVTWVVYKYYVNKQKNPISNCYDCGQKKSAITRTKHGLTGTPEHKAWCTIKTRCYNEKRAKYKNYGGRGITVCDRWQGINGFKHFLSDMGKRPTSKHSIERIDNNKGYEPNNCRWALNKEQANNRRSTVKITIDNKTLSITQWSELLKVERYVLYLKARNGVTMQEAISRLYRELSLV